MSASDADAAARVIERLLSDAAFRAEFRRDPAAACREAGLDELAEEMSYGAGKALQTLDIRESRSSLAGVMMAAALEGVGIIALVEGFAPGAAAAQGAVGDVLSRVNLPKVDAGMGLRGALAPTPGIPSSGAAADSAGSGPGAPGAAPAPAAAPEPARAPEPAPAPEAPAGNVHAVRAAAPDPDAPSTPAAGGADAPPLEPQPAAAPVDPAQFGAEGTGGAPSAETLELIENKNVSFDQDGLADLRAGRIDPRVVSVLSKLAEDHKITVSCMCSDHPALTAGGSPSNHHFGRGVDIAAIDGMPVNAANPIAREIATDLSSLDPGYRPDEIGTPWAIDPSKGYFTDADHADHIHVGFKQAIDPSWKPPADLAAAPPPAAGGATAGAGGTLSIAVPQHASAPAAGATLSVGVPPAAGAPAAASGSGAATAAESLAAAAGSGGTQEAGAKALAAVHEALRYKGTDYVWGGSTPKTGFDCSGLVQWAYAKQGISIPRVTYDQIEAGTAVGRKHLVPGDLVFFSNHGDVHHVGISLGGDRFLHAPHTGDKVKESSLTEDYYAQQFAGGRRFDATPAGAADATPVPEEVQAAGAALARDAAELRNPNSMIFKALTKQEAGKGGSTVRFMPAVRPDAAHDLRAIASSAAPLDAPPVAGSLEYPGNDASQPQLAAWLAAHAQQAGLPPELPVMAALVESKVQNLPYGDSSSVGFFQMLDTWNTANDGAYAGFLEKPELQMKWFIDQALAVKQAHAGDAGYGSDPSKWGEWIADIERPAVQYRGRYQEQLEAARALLRPPV